MCGESVEVVERWVDGVEEWEKVRYIIEVLELQEGGVIHRLQLTRWEDRRDGEWAAERFILEFSGNRLAVVCQHKPILSSGFRTEAISVYQGSFEEIPAWFIPSELGDFIETAGVRKAFYAILDYLKAIFTEPFGEVE